MTARTRFVASCVAALLTLSVVACSGGDVSSATAPPPVEDRVSPPEDSPDGPGADASVDEIYAHVAAMAMAEDELLEYLYERARLEGEVVHYSSGSSMAEEDLVGFLERFPGVAVQFVSIRAIDAPDRVLSEMRAGRHIVDVVTASLPVVTLIGDGGALALHHGVPVPAEFPQERVRPDLVDYRATPYVTVWNTNLVDSADAPREWDDFLLPEHAGCATSDGGLNFFSSMVADRGLAAMEDWVDGFLANGGVVRSGLSAVLASVAAGEFPCMAGGLAPRVEAMIVDDGAPLEWAVPSVTPANVGALGVAAHAPNPYAAALYAYWLLGADGAQLLANGGDIPVFPGAISPYERLQEFSEPGSDINGRLAFVPHDRVLELQEDAASLVDRLTAGMGSER
jgi:iron(III) transport system substrate-binding protein